MVATEVAFTLQHTLNLYPTEPGKSQGVKKKPKPVEIRAHALLNCVVIFAICVHGLLNCALGFCNSSARFDKLCAPFRNPCAQITVTSVEGLDVFGHLSVTKIKSYYKL
ncbi:hypothetical protein ILYODFUR_026776 [Ilyodon furcidens]|uniref:Uncharacterized protein n=1 Tax=Ilyodon furcidens TaxID=33524 RepID=A0ABV0TLZ0_9TELE